MKLLQTINRQYAIKAIKSPNLSCDSDNGRDTEIRLVSIRTTTLSQGHNKGLDLVLLDRVPGFWFGCSRG